MTTKRAEAAAELRQQLKRRGWTSRQVSVRSERCTYSSALRVVIKDPNVPLHVVERLARLHESVRRCEASGEILSGGNTYVTVAYSGSAMDALSELYSSVVAAALARIPEGDESAIERATQRHGVSRGRFGQVEVWGRSSHVATCTSARKAAGVIAIREQQPEDGR